MKKIDYLIILVLFLLAIFIWVRDLSWAAESADTLPVLVAIPLFIWLGMPWKWKKDDTPIPSMPLIISATLFVVGIGTNLTLFLAISWTLLLWTWLKFRTEESTHSKIKKLLVLPIMAFPWITLDAGQVGWWFRLSSATVTAGLFSLFGADVQQEGTNILINKLPISVEAACAGLNTLQSMLIAGTVVAFLFLGNSPRYWWNLPLLVVMTWVANTVRIIVIIIAALKVNAEFALGTFHTLGGWIVLMIMFSLCWVIFSWQEPKTQPETTGKE
jgi:exosortase